MEKPVFSSDILSFCKEMGVESPEQLIEKKICFKVYFSHFDKTYPAIVFSQIAKLYFYVGKNDEVNRIDIYFSDNEECFLSYLLKEKKWEYFKTNEHVVFFERNSPAEIIYVYE